MKINCKIRIVLCLFGVLAFLAECKAAEMVNESLQETKDIQEEKQHVEPAKIAEPKIVFENKVHNFGNLGVKETAECGFKFKNIGQSLLKIGKIKATCGCTDPILSKKEYKPGEEGIIKIKYSGQSKLGTVAKHIYVSTNDKANSKVKLTIKAKVIEVIETIPSKLQLSWNKENAGATNITIKSNDGRSFSIKVFSASKDVIKAGFDPNTVANEFILSPTVDIQKLKKCHKGNIRINLTHPKCSFVTIPYEVPPKFQCQPSRIILHNVDPNESQIKELLIKSTEEKQFEIESVSSKHGYIKVISQKPDEDKIKLKLQITPPPIKAQTRHFSDDLFIKIKNDEKLTISCSGFYRRNCMSSAKMRQKAF